MKYLIKDIVDLENLLINSKNKIYFNVVDLANIIWNGQEI